MYITCAIYNKCVCATMHLSVYLSIYLSIYLVIWEKGGQKTQEKHPKKDNIQTCWLHGSFQEASCKNTRKYLKNCLHTHKVRFTAGCVTQRRNHGTNNVKCSQEEQSNILYRRLFWGIFQLYLHSDSWRERERESEVDSRRSGQESNLRITRWSLTARHTAAYVMTQPVQGILDNICTEFWLEGPDVFNFVPHS